MANSCRKCVVLNSQIFNPNGSDVVQDVGTFVNLKGHEFYYVEWCPECLPNGCITCNEVRRFMYALDPYNSLFSN